MSDDAKERILKAAIELRLKSRDSGITVEAVARYAGCAKGLVAYHYKSKRAVFLEAERAIAGERLRAWTASLALPDPHGALDACWEVIRKEAQSGVATYRQSELTDWSTNDSLTAAIGAGAVGLLRRAGRVPTVAVSELADLCAVTLPGFARALAAGADPGRIEGAYAGFWAALFALTRAA